MSRTGPSPRVRLEVALLDADPTAPSPTPPAAVDEHPRLTVLVVAAEADLRRYVRECLRERGDLRVVEAATVPAAVALAADESPELLIVDEPVSAVVVALSGTRAIVLVDDLPRHAPAAGPRRRLLVHPFTGEELLLEVGRALG